MKKILVTTKHRGVFLAQADDDADISLKTLTGLKNGIMVINWRNGKGVQGIATDGPDNCKLSAMSDIPVLHDVTAVFSVTDAAAEKIWNYGK